MRTYFTNVEFLIGDVNYSVDFDYQPYEQQTMTYPGCPASTSIEGIYVNGELQDVCDLDEDDLEELEIETLKYAQTYNF